MHSTTLLESLELPIISVISLSKDVNKKKDVEIAIALQ
jgi:hypothetical protein